MHNTTQLLCDIKDLMKQLNTFNANVSLIPETVETVDPIVIDIFEEIISSVNNILNNDYSDEVPQNSNSDEASVKKEVLNDILNELNHAIENITEEISTPSYMRLAAKIIRRAKRKIIPWRKELRYSMHHVSSVVSVRAKNAIFDNTKVGDAIFTPDTFISALLAKPLGVKVNATNAKKEILTLLSIDIDEMKQFGAKIAREDILTNYDREVLNAIITLSAAGNEYINPSMIFQVLCGNSGKSTKVMGLETREEILRSVDKMMCILVTIDARDEIQTRLLKKYSGLEDKVGIYKGPIVPAERVAIISLNSHEVTDCIHLFRNSPLYTYALDKHQVGSFDIRMFDTPLINTSENIALKGFLVRRYKNYLNEKSKMGPTIRYETIYEHLNVTAPNKNALNVHYQSIRDKVKSVFDSWIKNGFLESYVEEKEGRSIAKITIIVDRDKLKTQG